MYGYLVPSSGGKSLPLRKTRLFLGRAKGSDAPLSRENAFCQLELIEGFWHVEDLNTPNGVKINGRTCKRERLMPDDELTIGSHRYRISFEAPKFSGVGKLAKPRPAKARPMQQAGRTAIMSGGSPLTPPDRGILARLVPVGGGQETPITARKVTIGRKPPCDVVIERRSISSMHCRLELIGGYWQALDLDSRNGIRIDNVAVKKGWVMPAARLSLAEHRFQLNYVGVGPRPIDSAASEEAGSDQRSLMEKLGLSDDDLDRAGVETPEKEQTERQRRWNLTDND